MLGLRLWLRLTARFDHIGQVDILLLLFLDFLLFFLVDFLHARLRSSFLFLLAIVLLLQLLLGLLISPIVISKVPTVFLLMLQPFKPVVHIILCNFDRMPNILLIGLLEKQILLMIVAFAPD